MTDCLNYGDPNDPEIYYELHQSVAGMAQACEIFDTPVISGNVSLYNENNGEAIYGTPMVGMVGLIADTKHIIQATAKNAGELLYLVGSQTKADFAGSELQKMLTGKISGTLAPLDLKQLAQTFTNLHQAMKQGLVTSSHDASEGGLGVCLAELFFKTELGAKVKFDFSAAELFSETAGRFLVTVAKKDQQAFEALLGQAQVLVGEVTQTKELDVTVNETRFTVPVATAQKVWEEAIPCLMRSKA